MHMKDPMRFLQANLQLLAGVAHSSTSVVQEAKLRNKISAIPLSYSVSTLTMAAVRSQRIAVRADAPEGSRNIMATESALMSHFLAFVHVLTDLHRTGSETLSTVAFEASFHISTRAVSTNVCDSAFVVIWRNELFSSNAVKLELIQKSLLTNTFTPTAV